MPTPESTLTRRDAPSAPVWPNPTDRTYQPPPVVEARITFRCQSGRNIEGVWTGTPIPALLDRAQVPLTATHLLAQSGDDAQACVPITNALTALLAHAARRDRQPVPDDHLPRLVGPDITGPRALKQLTRLDALTLAPGTPPTAFEHLPE